MWDEPTSAAEAAKLKTAAAELCAAILSRERKNGRFTIEISQAPGAMKLTPEEFELVVTRAIELDWVRVSSDRIELKAAASTWRRSCSTCRAKTVTSLSLSILPERPILSNFIRR